MTSTRKAAANKRNASLSTGPRTLGGKQRSSLNSYRHGLATPIAKHTSAAVNIDRLATVLAAYSNDYWRIEKARTSLKAISILRASGPPELRFCGELGVSKTALVMNSIKL